MTPAEASRAWQSRQAQLLRQTYVAAWERGEAAYRGQYATPPASPPDSKQSTGLSQQAMNRALAPALASLARMGAIIATIVPTAAAVIAAGSLPAAYRVAVHEYLERNAWLLAAGISVAWAGEQAGYAQAAEADGLLLEWQLDPVAHHCADCPALANLPPMPLAAWPTLPGEGATDCNVGCRCSMNAVPAPIPDLDAEQQHLITGLKHRHVLIAA
jgi:hypothetical protein